MDAEWGLDAEPVEHVVPVNTPRQWVRLLLGLGTLAALDAYFVAAAVRGHETRQRVGGTVFAVLLTILFVAILAGGVIAVSRREFVMDGAGIRFRGGRRPWTLRWSEIRSITLQSGRSGARGSGRGRRGAVVRLLVELTDGAVAGPLPPTVFRNRWGASATGYGIPLGPVPELVAPLDAALRSTAGDAYAGSAIRGRSVGLL